VAAGAQPQEGFKAKELLQKDLNAYAGGDLERPSQLFALCV